MLRLLTALIFIAISADGSTQVQPHVPVGLKPERHDEYPPKVDDWIVIQRRNVSKSPEFGTNGWQAYKLGFGDFYRVDGYWAGLELIHSLTKKGRWRLLTNYQFEKGGAAVIYHDDFKVANELHFYQLSLGNVAYKSFSTHLPITLKDELLRYSDGAYFTTIDKDVDKAGNNCAPSHKGGWWFKSCHRYCPNCKKDSIFYAPTWHLVSETTMAIQKIS